RDHNFLGWSLIDLHDKGIVDASLDVERTRDRSEDHDRGVDALRRDVDEAVQPKVDGAKTRDGLERADDPARRVDEEGLVDDHVRADLIDLAVEAHGLSSWCLRW